ncbi:hypothetical protein B0H14DRAFT_3135585 [Mycena olivaceomarginata]|nr:hypothetical protein B0H14DRAFT_3135585 [Mycena olivaceomarginata]
MTLVVHLPNVSFPVLVQVPPPWFQEKTAGNLKYGRPSETRLVQRLTRYMPPIFRGKDPDRRSVKPPLPDRAWEDPIALPGDIPESVYHPIHGNVYSAVAPASLANPLPLPKEPKAPAKPSKPGKAPAKPAKPAKAPAKTAKATTKSKAAKSKSDMSDNTRLTTFFPSLKAPKPRIPRVPGSVQGISSHLESLGIPKFPDLDENDIDHSHYLLPSILIESLLHASPQIFRMDFSHDDWIQVTRVPAKERGFKVVIALQLKTHTIAWLSMDNLTYVHWLSQEDMALTRPNRVPDVVLDHWRWSEFVVRWLKKQDNNPKKTLDRKSFAEVLSMPGHHPMRGVGRYSSDEIAHQSGVPLWTLWRDIRLNPQLLCAVFETFFLFTFERYCAVPDFLKESDELNRLCGDDDSDTDSSHLIITTLEKVLRYERYLSVHKQLWSTMSARKKRLVLRYNV